MRIPRGLQRVQVKKMLDEWEIRSPGRRQAMFRALTNVCPSHLPNPAIFDFANLLTKGRTFSENPLHLLEED